AHRTKVTPLGQFERLVTWGRHGRRENRHDRLALELNRKSERDKANRRKQRDGGNGEPHVLLPSRAGGLQLPLERPTCREWPAGRYHLVLHVERVWADHKEAPTEPGLQVITFQRGPAPAGRATYDARFRPLRHQVLW